MAFKWLEKSFEKHEESLCSLKIDPKMDSLRSDPRFNLLLKKIGFED
jgi:adenylate cyclase